MSTKKTKNSSNKKDHSKRVSICKRLWKKWKAFSRLKKTSIIASTLLTIYTITGFFIIPAVAKSVAQKELTKQLGRKVTIEHIHFNPYTLVLKVNNFKIGNSDENEQFFSVKEVMVNLETVSIFKLAVIIKEVKVDTPILHIARTGMVNFDFDDLVELVKTVASRRMPEPKVESEEPSDFKFSVNNIRLLNAQLYVKDKFEKKEHSLIDLNMSIPFVSNYEYHIDNYVTPLLSGNLNGSKFKFEGHSKPFKYSRETVIDFDVNNMDIAHFDEYIPNFFIPKLESCIFNSNLKLSFQLPEGQPPELTLDGGFSISDINLTLNGNSLFSQSLFALEINPSNLLAKKVHLNKILIAEPSITIERRKDGTLNFSDIIKASSTASVDAEEDSEHEVTEVKELEAEIVKEVPAKQKAISLADFVDLTIDAVILDNATVSLSDQAIKDGFETTVSEITLELKNLSTTSPQPATVDFGLRASNGESVKLDSQLSLVDLNAKVHLAINNINPPVYAPYYQQFLNAKLSSGKLSIETDANIDLANFVVNELIVSDTKITLTDFVLQNRATHDILALPLIEIITDKADLIKGEVIVNSVKLSNGGVNIVRNSDNTLNLMDIVNLDALPKSKAIEKNLDEEKMLTEDGDVIVASDDTAKKTFRLLLKTFQIENYGISVEDRATVQNTETVLYNINVKVDNIDTTPDTVIDFSVSSKINNAGEFSSSGTVNAVKKALQIKLNLDKFSLSEFQPYINEFCNATLESGLVAADAVIDVDAADLKKPKVTIKANSAVTKFSVISTDDEQKILGWDAVSVSNVDVTTEPLAITIGKISVDGQYAHVTVNEDRTLNFSKIAKKSVQDNQNIDEAVVEKGPETTEAKSTPLELPAVTFKAMELNNCSLTITDNSLKPEFESEVKEITLKLGEVSTKNAKDTDILLTALIDRHSKFEVKGKINPLHKQPSADLNIAIRDIDLSSLTPYSGKYVGYELAKGKLQLMLNYQIKEGKITANNDVLLDQLTFGESVDSDDATSLPIKFALSIITDKRGQVKLDVPISGDLNDPKFSIGGAVLTVLSNIFTNIVTSPFSFIASMYGGSEELKTIEFEAGGRVLSSKEMEKMVTIAEMMQDRPGIRIDVKGYADPKQDREKILADRFELFLKTAMYNDLWKSEQKETSIDKMVINWDDSEEYEEILEEAYDNAPFEKDENFLGVVKSKPVDVMESMIKNYLKVTDSELRKLAIKRAEVISKYLIETGKIDAARIFFIEPDREEVENKMSVNIDIK